MTEHAGSIWYGDVMHGPTLLLNGRRRKTYLVSLFDDASRLVTHSAFCLSETALEIEGVLKQALLRRGIPGRLVVDNGSAYRSATLQGICARLSIRLIYCRPYQPAAKGKIERWHDSGESAKARSTRGSANRGTGGCSINSPDDKMHRSSYRRCMTVVVSKLPPYECGNVSPVWVGLRPSGGTERETVSSVGTRPIVLKNSLLCAAGPAREKSASQIVLYAAREHRLGVRGPLKTSLKSWSGSFSTQSANYGHSSMQPRGFRNVGLTTDSGLSLDHAIPQVVDPNRHADTEDLVARKCRLQEFEYRLIDPFHTVPVNFREAKFGWR